MNNSKTQNFSYYHVEGPVRLHYDPANAVCEVIVAYCDDRTNHHPVGKTLSF
jgi:hypothetical protein